MKTRAAAVLIAGALFVSCTPQNPPSPNQLADNQVLRAAIPYEVGLDPAEISTDVEYSVAQNLFDGLYRFDERLNEVPDLAAAMPDVTPDGLTYTLKLRHDAEFSDHRPVTAADVVYSWNRTVDDPAAALSTIFQPVVGYQAVVDSVNNGDSPPPLRGLSAVDPHTVVVHLSTPAGYFLTTLALPAAWVLNQADIEANGDNWSNQPNGAIGTGPFRVTSRVLGRSTTLVPVENWWRGSTGWLKRIEIHVVVDGSSELRGYMDGRFDLIGLGGYGPQSEAALMAERLVRNGHGREVHTFPYGRTDWLGFDVAGGPFSGPEGLWGRLALSRAIDRKQLAAAVCAGGFFCVPATGGLISKGLAGYLGEGADSNSVYDPKAAQADLEKWDPDGTKRREVIYVYIAAPLFREIANSLHDQWKKALGLDVRLQGYVGETFFYDRLFGAYSLFRGSWAADYNNPQDWYDIFTSSPSPSGSGFADPAFVSLVAHADASSGKEADASYRQAGQMLIDQEVVAPLVYFTRTVVVKDYVAGFGANALYPYPLTDVKVLQH